MWVIETYSYILGEMIKTIESLEKDQSNFLASRELVTMMRSIWIKTTKTFFHSFRCWKTHDIRMIHTLESCVKTHEHFLANPQWWRIIQSILFMFAMGRYFGGFHVTIGSKFSVIWCVFEGRLIFVARFENENSTSKSHVSFYWCWPKTAFSIKFIRNIAL